MHNENTKRLDVLDQQDVSFHESLGEINRELIMIGSKAVPRADIENALARMREGLSSELNDIRMRVSRLEELNFRRFGRGNIDGNGSC